MSWAVSGTTLKKRLTARLSELEAKEEHYLDLVGEPGWPKAKLQKKLHTIASERTEIEGQLADTTTKLNAGRMFFLTALELLRAPQVFYRRGDASVKHALTKVIFAKLYLDMRDITLVSSHDLGEGLGDLIEAEERRRTYLPAQRHAGGLGRLLGRTGLERQHPLRCRRGCAEQSHRSRPTRLGFGGPGFE